MKEKNARKHKKQPKSPLLSKSRRPGLQGYWNKPKKTGMLGDSADAQKHPKGNCNYLKDKSINATKGFCQNTRLSDERVRLGQNDRRA